MTVESHGNVLVAGTGINVDTSDGLDRSEDALLVAISPEGNVLRATDLDLAGGTHRSDDKARLMALDPQDNVYMVVHQYAVIDDQGQSTSWLVSFDRNGTLRWKEQISDHSDVGGLYLVLPTPKGAASPSWIPPGEPTGTRPAAKALSRTRA